MGVSVIVAITVLALTRTLTPVQALSGFSNVTVWLVFTAFLFARAVTATGFGTRVGYLFIQRFARTPLSLGYSLAAADLALAPFIPSDTARGGGIVFPVVRSVAADFGSVPGPTSKLIGEFLVLVSYHTTYTASAIFPHRHGRQSAHRRIRPPDRPRRAHLDPLARRLRSSRALT